MLGEIVTGGRALTARRVETAGTVGMVAISSSTDRPKAIASLVAATAVTDRKLLANLT